MKVIPKPGIPPKPAVVTDSAFATGALVMYENDGAPLIGVVLGYKKSKHQVLNNRGREVELQPIRLHRLPEHLPGGLDTLAAKSDFLGRLHDECAAAALALDLSEIWTLVHDEAIEHSTASLCRTYFGTDNLKHHITLRLALIGDKIFFKRHDDEFAPRTPETVEELRKSEASRQKKAAIQETLVRFAADRLRDPTTPIPTEIEPLIHLLEDIAAGAHHVDNNRHREAKDLVNLIADKLGLELGGNREQRVIELLEQLGHFTPDTNLAFVRHRLPGAFDEAALAQAAALPRPDLTFGGVTRRDLTGVPTITIDDISTRDMDDALSLEAHGDGFLLGIHISDVAACIPIDSPLDLEGRRRATSIYSPDRTIHMFPDHISSEVCSLIAGAPRAAVSCLFSIDRQFVVTHAEIVPTLVHVTERLTYDEVDARLERGDDLLNNLYNIACTLEADRIAKGAIKVHKRDVMVGPGPTGELLLTEIDENAPSRALVSEMMVLANSFMATFAAERKIPCVFRGQPPPDPDNGRAASVPEGPAADYAARSRLKKSTTSLRPERHSSLALDAYLQATSPIRRYADLLNQRQLHAALAGKPPPYSSTQLLKVLESIEGPLADAQAVSKETRRFWALRYMRSVGAARRTIGATVLRTDLKTPLVEVDEIFTPFLARIPFPVVPGDTVRLRIIAVDPRFDHIRLEAVRE
jgi:exoribonuclease-2